MRQAQKLEPLSIEELRSIGNQLRDAADVCFRAVETMEAKNARELQVLYKASILNGLSSVNRTRESVYESWRMLEMGQTVKVSPRSVTRKKAIAKISEAQSALSVSRKRRSDHKK